MKAGRSVEDERIPTEEFLVGVNSICYSQAAAKGVEYECIVDPVLDDYYMGDAMKLQQGAPECFKQCDKIYGRGRKGHLSAAQRHRTKNDAVLGLW